MTRFEITRWCDFVRGLAGPEEAEEMRRSLAGPRPSREATAMRRVAELARADRALDIPEYAIRGAKAIGSLQRHPAAATDPATPSVWKQLSFEIVFDSLLHPAAAGTRELQSWDRQIVYRSSDYTVDVRVEYETDSTVLVGEILRKSRPLSEVPILVAAGDHIIARSLSGEFGEFQAEDLPRDSLNLSLLVGSGERIDLPLGLH